jgi:transcriptional regulator with XRE-family HTH domain
MNDIYLSKILRERLKGQNLTAIAKELDIPKTLIHDWVQSRRMPSMKNIKHVKVLADYLGMTLEELLLGEDKSIKKILANVNFEDEGTKYQISITKI